jgi:hypothetical protein
LCEGEKSKKKRKKEDWEMGLEEGKCARRGREDSRRLDITRWLLSPRQPTTHKRTTTS